MVSPAELLASDSLVHRDLAQGLIAFHNLWCSRGNLILGDGATTQENLDVHTFLGPARTPGTPRQGLLARHGGSCTNSIGSKACKLVEWKSPRKLPSTETATPFSEHGASLGSWAPPVVANFEGRPSGIELAPGANSPHTNETRRQGEETHMSLARYTVH